jgi:hypothetical protein
MLELQEPRPMTVKGMLRAAGIKFGGGRRARISRAIDNALFAIWEKGCAEVGPEDTAIVLFALVAFDPHFRHPLWLKQRFRAHRAAITTAVQTGDIRKARWVLEQL